jgi:hypothetical protein
MATSTYTDENVGSDRRREDGRAATIGDVAELTDNLHALAALGEGDNGWDLRLEESCFLIGLHTEED